MATIYKITNTCNGKAYIGQTTKDPTLRINDHLNCTQNGSRLIKRAVEKYGRDTFIVEILHDGVFDFMLDDLERQAIKTHNTLVPNGYNLDSGGHVNKTLSAEHRAKISESLKGNKNNLGRKLSDEHKKKISEVNKGNKNNLGKKRSDEHKQKISEANKGKNNHNYGKKHTAETRLKMSESMKGKSPWNKGKKGVQSLSPEHRAKISESLKGNKNTLGRKLSDEHKKKISESLKKTKQLKKFLKN